MKINKSKLFQEFFDEAKNREIKHLVLHHIAAPTFDLAIDELKKHKVSSHYIINLDGEIFQLVEERNIAYHAGVSFWNGQDGLNKTSIGIEFYNPEPFEKEFPKAQIEAGIALCQEIISRYKITSENIVGHSDIAYFKDTGCLGRKQDPGPLFPWKEFYKNGVGKEIDREILELIKEGGKIKKLKQKLKNLGYKINVDENFDEQLKNSIKLVLEKSN